MRQYVGNEKGRLRGGNPQRPRDERTNVFNATNYKRKAAQIQGFITLDGIRKAAAFWACGGS